MATPINPLPGRPRVPEHGLTREDPTRTMPPQEGRDPRMGTPGNVTPGKRIGGPVKKRKMNPYQEAAQKKLDMRRMTGGS